MYKSRLHSLLVKALASTAWTASTKDEDNYRQVLCLALSSDIAAGNIQIPSTRSGQGDIQLFGRKIELKYANNMKGVHINSFADDFILLLSGDIDFAILAIALDRTREDGYVNECVQLPKLKATGASNDFYKGKSDGASAYKYAFTQISLLLAAAYPHALTDVGEKDGQGNRSTAYLSFEPATSIARSSMLEIQSHRIHVDVIGSKEDGILCYLYKRADGIELIDDGSGSPTKVAIPYTPAPIAIAELRYADVHAKPRTTAASASGQGKGERVEGSIPIYVI